MSVPSLTEIVPPVLDHPPVCVVRGEIDISNAAEFRAGLAAAFAQASAVVVDLSEVVFMASAGVRVLVDAGADPRRRMAIVVGPGVATILRICGMAGVVPCVADRATAERACRG